VHHLTKHLAFEWARHQIRSTVSPPASSGRPDRADSQRKESYDRYAARIPLGRAAKPEDFVGAALFLASPASEMVTAHVLNGTAERWRADRPLIRSRPPRGPLSSHGDPLAARQRPAGRAIRKGAPKACPAVAGIIFPLASRRPIDHSISSVSFRMAVDRLLRQMKYRS
jgi:hypothetical protein